MVTSVYTAAKCLEHASPGHPESPDRLRAALQGLLAAGESSYRWPELRPAEVDLVQLVHAPSHVQQLLHLQNSGGGWVDPDTFVGPASVDAALHAAGGVLQAVQDVANGATDNAFVVARPPGHHALADRAMGFCLLNSVAIGAAWAVRLPGINRVAVLDIDVHHGNGTEAIFYDRPDILYYSTHQYPFYPGTGALQNTGGRAGSGFTVNLPLPAGSGDETFMAATVNVLTPVLRRYQPDLMIVSVGFDAHWADPLARMRMSTPGYAAVLTEIRALATELCAGRLIVVLEGGYNLDVIAEGASMVGAILRGAAPGPTLVGWPTPAPEPSGGAAAISTARDLHQVAA